MKVIDTVFGAAEFAGVQFVEEIRDDLYVGVASVPVDQLAPFEALPERFKFELEDGESLEPELTKAQIVAKLETAGIEFDPRANKATLLELLNNATV